MVDRDVLSNRLSVLEQYLAELRPVPDAEP